MGTTNGTPNRLPIMSASAVWIYPNGTITDMGHLLPPAGFQAPQRRRMRKRNRILTFSRASAARLRRLLARSRGPDGWPCFGATMTIPGPPVTVDEWHRIWNAFRHKLLRRGGIVLIWRIEMQERGQPHVHCVCWGKTGQGRMREYWDDAIGLLGPAEGPSGVDYSGRSTCGEDYCEFTPGWAKATRRWLWPGASTHAVRIDGLGDREDMAWWRYLAAHASKSKQAQLGWKGRQWGIVNRPLLALADPVMIELPRKAMYKARRYLQKLTGCLYATGHGMQTWFANPRPVMCLCEWARAEVEAQEGVRVQI